MEKGQVPVQKMELHEILDEMATLFSRLANRMSYLEDLIVKITLCNLGQKVMPEDLKTEVLGIGLGKITELTDEEISAALGVAMVDHLKVCTTCKDKVSNGAKEVVLKEGDLN